MSINIQMKQMLDLVKDEPINIGNLYMTIDNHFDNYLTISDNNVLSHCFINMKSHLGKS